MNASVFFLNRTRFWTWIFLPLIIRALVTPAFSYFSIKPFEKLEKLRAYEEAYLLLEQSVADAESAIKPFLEDEALPFQGQFLTQISRQSKNARIESKTESSTKQIDKKSLTRSVFSVKGGVSSLHEFSVFMDYMMQSPKAAIVDLSINTQMNRDTGIIESFGYSVKFERIEHQLGGKK